MSWRSQIRAVSLYFAVQGFAAAAECAWPDSSTAASSEQFRAYLEQQLASGNTDCATSVVSRESLATKTLSGKTRVDRQFELRNLALSINGDSTLSLEARIAVVKAAASSLQGPAPTDDTEAAHYDALLLLRASETYLREAQPAARLEALAAAITLDQRVPPSRQVVKPYDVYSLGDYRSSLRPLIALAMAIKGAPALASARCHLAFVTYYNVGAFRTGDRSTESRVNADLIMQLMDAIGDDMPMCSNVPAHWQWRPTLEAGVAYYQLDPSDARARSLIERAVKLVRTIPDDDARLLTYLYLLPSLLASNYDRSLAWILIDEAKSLSTSLQSGTAKDARERLPRILKNAGMEN